MKAIDKAVEFFGTQRAMAEKIGTSQAFVSQWVTGQRPIPPKFCLRIERETAGKVTAAQLLPEVFGTDAA